KLAIAGTLNGEAVMLKVLKDPMPDHETADEEDEPEAIQGERFKREILAMRRVHSPRVVSVISGPDARAIGGHRHLWYLEPRYATTLNDHLGAAWTEPRVVALLEDLLTGLVALQAEHVVHRDIK